MSDPASDPAALAVATYNLWGGGEPWRYTAERGVTRGAVPGSAATTLRPAAGIWASRRRLVVEALRRAQPDVVGLQEVVDEPPMVDQIAEQLGYRSAVGGGLALLSRHRIVGTTYLPLPSPPAAGMQQGALIGEIAAPGGPVEVVTLHVTPRSEAARIAALDRLLGALAERRPVVVGDFNAAPEGATLALMLRTGWRDAWALARPGEAGATMPSHEPVARTDYVLVPAGAAVVAVERIGDRADGDGFYGSDHLGLVATMRLGR